ncbi:MAG: mannose-1-phosphate guanylyltransferase, partial [Pseudomonadota bacterium]
MTRLYPVIMSGGSGTRLWPLSRQARPKQYQSLVTNQSMLAETLDRIGTEAGAYDVAPPIIICGEDHRPQVENILSGHSRGSEATLILEPVGRNTAPVAVTASLHVAAQDPDGVILLLPADHHVTDKTAFQWAIQDALPIAERGFLTTFGIKPDRPETGYGYIKAGAALSEAAAHVEAFVEKPDLATAKDYLEAGTYSWNAGIFMFRAATLLEEAKRHAGEIYEATEAAFRASLKTGAVLPLDTDLFAQIPAQSIDYALMEKTDKAAMVGPV